MLGLGKVRKFVRLQAALHDRLQSVDTGSRVLARDNRPKPGIGHADLTADKSTCRNEEKA
jgi:hypothetical protein